MHRAQCISAVHNPTLLQKACSRLCMNRIDVQLPFHDDLGLQHTWSSRNRCTCMVLACTQAASLSSGTLGSSRGALNICLWTAHLQRALSHVLSRVHNLKVLLPCHGCAFGMLLIN